MCDKMRRLSEADIAEINGLFDKVTLQTEGFITKWHEEDGVRVIDEFKLTAVSAVHAGSSDDEEEDSALV